LPRVAVRGTPVLRELCVVDREEATRIIDDLEENVRTRWYAVARREGVSEQDCERIARAFVYPGFRLAVTR